MPQIQGLFDWALPVLDNVPVIRGIIGFVLVFLAPGFAWSLVFFRKINLLERFVLSFGISIALVTLSVLFLNMIFDMRITGSNSVIIILLLIIIPLIIHYTARYIRKRKIVLQQSIEPEMTELAEDDSLEPVENPPSDRNSATSS